MVLKDYAFLAIDMNGAKSATTCYAQKKLRFYHILGVKAIRRLQANTDMGKGNLLFVSQDGKIRDVSSTLIPLGALWRPLTTCYL